MVCPFIASLRFQVQFGKRTLQSNARRLSVGNVGLRKYTIEGIGSGIVEQFGVVGRRVGIYLYTDTLQIGCVVVLIGISFTGFTYIIIYIICPEQAIVIYVTAYCKSE